MESTRTITLSKEEAFILKNALDKALENEYETYYDKIQKKWFKRRKENIPAIVNLKEKYDKLIQKNNPHYILQIDIQQSSLIVDILSENIGVDNTGNITNEGKEADFLLGRFCHLFD